MHQQTRRWRAATVRTNGGARKGSGSGCTLRLREGWGTDRAPDANGPRDHEWRWRSIGPLPFRLAKGRGAAFYRRRGILPRIQAAGSRFYLSWILARVPHPSRCVKGGGRSVPVVQVAEASAIPAEGGWATGRAARRSPTLWRRERMGHSPGRTRRRPQDLDSPRLLRSRGHAIAYV